MSKVFISWSGDHSRRLAEAIRNWLPGVLQFVKPYFTPDDIEKGTKWSTEITKELEESEVGILCLTRDNLNNPWILFEAGALSKNFGKSKVCTVLFGIDSSDLAGPLTGFQDTKFRKEDFKKLIESINKSGGDSKLEPKVLDGVYDMWWPRLEEKINEIMSAPNGKDHSPTRSDREILEEVLELTRRGAVPSKARYRSPRKLFYEIFEIFDEMSHMMSRHGDDKMSFMLFERLRRPLKRLAMEADDPELYEKFMYRMDKRMHQLRFEVEEAEQGSGGNGYRRASL